MVVVIFVTAVIGAIPVISIIIIYSSVILTYDDNYSNKIVGHTAFREPEFVQFAAMHSRNFCK
jgi:hypothetical protein